MSNRLLLSLLNLLLQAKRRMIDSMRSQTSGPRGRSLGRVSGFDGCRQDVGAFRPVVPACDDPAVMARRALGTLLVLDVSVPGDTTFSVWH